MRILPRLFLSAIAASCPFGLTRRSLFPFKQPHDIIGVLTGPDYLQTMGIPLLRGRFFAPEDTTQSPCVAVIHSVFARMYFKAE